MLDLVCGSLLVFKQFINDVYRVVAGCVIPCLKIKLLTVSLTSAKPLTGPYDSGDK